MGFEVLHWGFPGGSDGKESACSVGESGLILGSERSHGEGNGNPLQYSCLENPRDRGAWHWAAVHGVSKSRTWLMDGHFHFHGFGSAVELVEHRDAVFAGMRVWRSKGRLWSRMVWSPARDSGRDNLWEEPKEVLGMFQGVCGSHPRQQESPVSFLTLDSWPRQEQKEAFLPSVPGGGWGMGWQAAVEGPWNQRRELSSLWYHP